MGGGDLADHLFLDQLLRATERTPRLGEDSVLTVIGELLVLREVRMHLDLVDDRADAGLALDALEVLGKEVRDPDLSHDSALLSLHQRLPRLHILVLMRVRPVDQVQVDRFDTEP